MNEEFYFLDVKRAVPFIETILDKFCGNSAISLEGDLSKVDFSDFAGVSKIETITLKRQTIWPTQDFVVLPLTFENVTKLKKLLQRIGIRNRVLHIQVESDGQIVLGSYDQFGKNETWISMSVGEEFVKELMHKDIIRALKENT
jgi:hypothetical protein